MADYGRRLALWWASLMMYLRGVKSRSPGSIIGWDELGEAESTVHLLEVLIPMEVACRFCFLFVTEVHIFFPRGLRQFDG